MSNLIKAITYSYPDEIPVSVGILPAAWIYYKQELIRLAEQYKDLVPNIPDLDKIYEQTAPNYHRGTHIDEWGCVWKNIDEGMEAYVVEHPVKTRQDIIDLQIPKNRDGHIPHGFMYLRLLDLRGFEEAMIDFAEECDELQILIDKVLEHNCIQSEILTQKSGDIVTFGDDLGMQNGLAIGVEKWRKYLKPCFKKIFSYPKKAGKYVYMHTDGMIYDIMPDLKECGADMINPQFAANGIDNLERVCKGKIPINLDLNRQIFPFATPRQLDEHVRECVERLYLPQGGLGLYVELNYDIPLENMAALFDALRKYRAYKG